MMRLRLNFLEPSAMLGKCGTLGEHVDSSALQKGVVLPYSEITDALANAARPTGNLRAGLLHCLH